MHVFTATEKLHILQEIETTSIKNVCGKHNVHRCTICQWKKQYDGTLQSLEPKYNRKEKSDTKKQKKYSLHFFSGTEKIQILKEIETGKIQDVCEKYKVSGVTVWRWKKQYDGTVESLEPNFSRESIKMPNAQTDEEKEIIKKIVENNPNASLKELYKILCDNFGYSRNPITLYKYIRKAKLKDFKVISKREKIDRTRFVDTKKIEKAVYELALKACTEIDNSCLTAIKETAEKETSLPCRFALETILENAEIAKTKQMPVCQDTGVAVVFMEIGQDVCFEGELLADAVNEGVRRAYKDGCFRASVCDPLTRKNTGDNTPCVLHTEIVKGDSVKITFLPKGFGSENMSKLFMLTPKEGVNGVIEALITAVKDAGSKPCPPIVVGVGIGGTFDSCAYLSKKALMREVGSINERADLAAIENEALEKINMLGIGAQGFGGDITALAVFCEAAPTHIAGLPVAVNIQCHCMRKAEIVI